MSTTVTRSTGSVTRSICCRSTLPAKAASCTSAAIRGLANGSLGRTKTEIAEAKAKGIQPTHGAGFAYLEGPDGAIIDYQGNLPTERFQPRPHVPEDPFCAELWYRQHLNAHVNQAPGRPVYTQANRKVAPPGPHSSPRECSVCRWVSALTM